MNGFYYNVPKEFLDIVNNIGGIPLPYRVLVKLKGFAGCKMNG